LNLVRESVLASSGYSPLSIAVAGDVTSVSITLVKKLKE
jgi:hypothetical protein